MILLLINGISVASEYLPILLQREYIKSYDTEIYDSLTFISFIHHYASTYSIEHVLEHQDKIIITPRSI